MGASDTVWAGPVLVACEEAHAIIAAIEGANAGMVVHDRGSYLRVLAPGRCTVTRDAIEQALGRRFCLPADLERIMPSFQGAFAVSEEAASWTAETVR